MSDDDSSREAPKATPARAPSLVRFGGTVGAAVLAALVGSSPGALRLAATTDLGVLRAWLTLAGLALAPMLVLVPLARLAREGLRGMSSGERALERVASAVFFACSWLWFLAFVGGVLRQKTHQHALAAVTFALLALGAAAFLALVARRLAVIFVALRSSKRALGTAVAVSVSALSVLALGLRVARSAPNLSGGARAMLVDGLALALALAFFARKTFDERRLVARVGPPVAVVLLIVAMQTVATSGAAVSSLAGACPLHFALLRAFGKLPL